MFNRQLTAWLIHLYTATGGIIGMFALLVAARGEIRLAFLLLIVTLVIDGTDGILARRARVREALPHFSGAHIDDIIDVLTYVWVPVFIMASQNLLPHPLWVAVPILAGLYAYGQIDMKTADNFFLGFPSYWNVVALYMYWLRPEPFWAVVMILVPAVLTVIPTRYLYPSKNDIFWRTTWLLTGLWLLLIIYLLFQESPDQRLILLSILYPAYYTLLSFYVEWKLRQDRGASSEAV